MYLPDWIKASKKAKTVSTFTHHCVTSIWYGLNHLAENYQLFVEWINMSPMLDLHDSPRIRSSHEFTKSPNTLEGKILQERVVRKWK